MMLGVPGTNKIRDSLRLDEIHDRVYKILHLANLQVIIQVCQSFTQDIRGLLYV